MASIDRLLEAVSAVAPVSGLSATSPGVDMGPGDVAVDYAPTATPEQIAAGNAALTSFDWSPEAHAAWLLQRAVAQAAAMLDSTDPIPQAVRVLERVQQDHSNEQWRRTAACLAELAAAAGHTFAADLPEPLLEPEMFARLVDYIQSGLSLPGPRPDVPA